MKIKFFIILIAFMLVSITPTKNAHAFFGFGPACSMSCTSLCCQMLLDNCQDSCVCFSDGETGSPSKYDTTMGHVTDEFEKHREWVVEKFFLDGTPGDPAGLLSAMQLMTQQLVTNSMQQVQIIGSFFDAKHQLETQRILQVASARAHKKYQPSEGFCSFGTMTQSLSIASRKKDLTSSALARRSADRQLFSGDNIAVQNAESDRYSRLQAYILNYCDPNDNAANLDFLCQNSNQITELFNKDINFANTIRDKWTLDVDLIDDPIVTDDERAIFALNDNLFANKLFPYATHTGLVDENGEPAYNIGAKAYMDSRSVIAKRSVAANSLAAITAMKAQSNSASQPFIYSLIAQMGGDQITANQIQNMIGENPSYYAQMKILSKVFFQRPEFYSNLYDKPENVKRLNASIQATKLMRKRDLYRSYLRTEMTMAVMLEAALEDEIRLIENEINPGGEN